MPKFLVVLAGVPLSDKKRPTVLPPALAQGLKRHDGAGNALRVTVELLFRPAARAAGDVTLVIPNLQPLAHVEMSL